jgi:hypothetical protein
MELQELVDGLAKGIVAADSRLPVAIGQRSGRVFQPGIGPHSESDTITLALAEPGAGFDGLRLEREVPYPAIARSRCDLQILGTPSWAVEIKLLRLLGDNGLKNDNMLMHLLSPYPVDHSALTDCPKLLRSGFAERKAIVIIGYDYDNLPMAFAIEAFEVLASRKVNLTAMKPAPFDGLIHPVHGRGAVFGWEITEGRDR